MNKVACHQIDTTLEQIFDTLTEVPTFPKVVQKALKLLDDPNTTIKELEDVLRYDPAITANILKLTNSAHFALPQQVTNLETALALLGQNQLRKILVASATMTYFKKPLPGYGLSAIDIWTHSIGCAITGELLARYLSFPDSSTLFTVGILHDIGKVILNLYVWSELDKIQKIALEQNITFMEAEWQVLGTDHAVIGSTLLKHWQFPALLYRAVRNHHDPDLYVQDDISAILALANIICAILGIGVGFDSYRYIISEDLLDKFNIDNKTFNLFLIKTIKEMKKVKDILSIVSE